MEDHLGYGKSQRSDNDDYRNGYKKKKSTADFADWFRNDFMKRNIFL